MLAGVVTKTKTKTLHAANKTLREAKTVTWGDNKDLQKNAYSDTSFTCRNDLSTQGGYML